MKPAAVLTGTIMFIVVAGGVQAANEAGCGSLLRHELTTLQGATQDLCAYQGKVLLIVNTASFCGFTEQYKGLEALYQKYRDRGLVVLGFPSNDFGRQEPASNREIAAFCERTYQVQFPMFGKSSVVGASANPVFQELIARSADQPTWNFHKYLVDRTGVTVLSFRSDVAPDSVALTARIESMLAAKTVDNSGTR